MRRTVTHWSSRSRCRVRLRGRSRSRGDTGVGRHLHRAPGPHARGHAGARRHAPGRRHRHAGRARRQDGRPARRSVIQDVDAKTPMKSRQHLPHRVDEQADYQRRRHDAVRGRQARADRSRVALHSRVPRHEGADARRPGRRADARASPATDHDARSPDASVGTHLRIPGQRAGRQRLSRRRRQRRTHRRGGAAGRERRPARAGRRS